MEPAVIGQVNVRKFFRAVSCNGFSGFQSIWERGPAGVELVGRERFSFDAEVDTHGSQADAEAYQLGVFQALRRLQQAAEVHAKRLSRYGGLTPLQQLILQVLDVRKELTASQLAGFVSLSPASLSGVLERLEGRGLIGRRRDQQDRRKQWLRLEAAGLDAVKNAPSLLPEHVRLRFAGLPEWERHAILAMLLRAAELFEPPLSAQQPESVGGEPGGLLDCDS